jgi:hypothetical protein
MFSQTFYESFFTSPKILAGLVFACRRISAYATTLLLGFTLFQHHKRLR